MMYIPMPSIHALHPSSNVSIKNEQLAIANLAELTKYATAVLSQENVTTALVGSTRLHEGKLPVNTITFNSTSTYKGELEIHGDMCADTDEFRSQWTARLQRHGCEDKRYCTSRTAKSARLRIHPQPIFNDNCYGSLFPYRSTRTKTDHIFRATSLSLFQLPSLAL